MYLFFDTEIQSPIRMPILIKVSLSVCYYSINFLKIDKLSIHGHINVHIWTPCMEGPTKKNADLIVY